VTASAFKPAIAGTYFPLQQVFSLKARLQPDYPLEQACSLVLMFLTTFLSIAGYSGI
jgi:hypothetical protein